MTTRQSDESGYQAATRNNDVKDVPGIRTVATPAKSNQADDGMYHISKSNCKKEGS